MSAGRFISVLLILISQLAVASITYAKPLQWYLVTNNRQDPVQIIATGDKPRIINPRKTELLVHEDAQAKGSLHWLVLDTVNKKEILCSITFEYAPNEKSKVSAHSNKPAKCEAKIQPGYHGGGIVEEGQITIY